METITSSTKTWTVLALIEWGAQYLKERGFEDARLNVELLLSHVLHLKRMDLYTSFDRPLDVKELGKFKSVLQRRLKHEPIQYIIGETEFMGLPLYVNPSVLIPRPETEELVERVLEWVKGLGTRRIEVLDIGTGSGNIPVALEKFSPNTHIISIDVSEEALQVAARNLERHHCSRVTLERLDVFAEILRGKMFDVIVANPPYISAAELQELQPEVGDFEPKIATTDNADGLRFVRRICWVAAKKLRIGGLLLMEVAYNRSAEAKSIAAAAGLSDVEVFKDLAGNERMLQGVRVV